MQVRTFFVAILFAVGLSAYAQNGLGQGQGVVAPSTNPSQARKACDHCGIAMGNATYPWQHESWCPYYRPQSSGARSSVSAVNVARLSVASTAMSAVGSLLSGLISNKATKPVDNTQYENDSFGGQTTFGSSYIAATANDNHTLVVLRDAKTQKVGVWHNAYQFYSGNPGSSSYQWVTGFWMLQPVYEEIYLGQIDAKKDKYAWAVVRTDVKKKGETEAQWDVYYLDIKFCDKGNPILISPFKGSRVNFDLRSGWVSMAQKDSKTGEEKWGLWDIDLVQKFYRGKYGYKEVGMIEKIAPQYSYLGTPVGPNKWTFAQKEKGGDIGIVNDKNAVCFPFEFSSVRTDPDALMVKKDGNDKWALLFNDKTRTDYLFDEVTLPVGGYAFRQGDKWGFASYGKGGPVVLPAEYESITREVLDPELINNVYDGPALIVKKNNRWGVYEMNGNALIPEVIPKREEVLYYLGSSANDSYALASRSERKALRSKAGEFESDADFQARLRDASLEKQYEEKALLQFQKQFIVDRIKAAHDARGGLSLKWGSYDKEQGAFPFTSNLSTIPTYLLPVPIDEGPAFREALPTLKYTDAWPTASFFLCDDVVQIGELTLKLPNGKTYRYVHPKFPQHTGPVVKYKELF